MGLARPSDFLDDPRLLCATDLARDSGTWCRISLTFCKLAFSGNAGSEQGVDVYRQRRRVVAHRLVAVSVRPRVPERSKNSRTV